MGMPASAALLLKALTDEKDTWLHYQAKELVNRFSLFAIILADPKKDSEFYGFVQKNFSHFHRITGENLLFFSIVTDAEYQQKGTGWNFRLFNDINAYRENSAAEPVIHSEFAIHAICAILGIDYDETPCLIISDNLQFGDFHKINTNSKVLEKQLTELCRFADLKKNNLVNSSFKTLLNKYNEGSVTLSNTINLHTDKSSIQIISEILLSITNQRYFNNENIDNLKKRLLQIIPENKDVINERVDDALLLLMYYRHKDEYHNRIISKSQASEVSEPSSSYNHNLKVKQEALLIPELLIRDWHNIQASTKNYLESSLLTYKSHQRFYIYTQEFSSYTSPLCKSFENEIKLSVVQLIREFKGVSMPKYFNRFSPENIKALITPSEYIIKNPQPINFNKLSNGEWQSPGLGETRLIFETLNSERPGWTSDWLPVNRLNILNSNWKTIQKVRNDSMHTSPVNINLKKDLEASFQKLHQYNILNELTKLKKKLRGDSPS